MMIVILIPTRSERCVVTRRLPSFGLRVHRGYDVDSTRKPAVASRQVNGVCHMSRLKLINNTMTFDPMPGAVYSAQMCSHTTNAELTCSMLAQNMSSPADSSTHLHKFPVSESSQAARSLSQIHPHKTRCTSCHKANLTQVLTRLMQSVPISPKAREQLSFGRPQRISTERLIAAHLHRKLCGANNTCQSLKEAVCGGGGFGGSYHECMRRGEFMPSLLTNLTVPVSVIPSSDTLWSRNWVFCPHTAKAQVGPSQDASVDIGVCTGSVPKDVWLDPSRRVSACTQSINEDAPSSPSVNFCLINAETQNLCLKMAAWKQRTEYYLCQAAGICEESDFFYSPTTFNLQEQEFVSDTVQRYYIEDAGLSCPLGSSSSNGVKEQQNANENALQYCSSVKLSPLLIVLETFREGKRALVLLSYHGIRVCFRFLQVFLAVTVDAAASIASTATNSVQAAAEALLTEITAFMLIIGDFVEQIGSSIMELALSRGVGSTLKEIIMAMCVIVRWIYNSIWAAILCPIAQFVLDYFAWALDIWKMVVNALRAVGIPTKELYDFIEWTRTLLDTLSSFLGECSDMRDICTLPSQVAEDSSTTGTLPMPTRCWSAYVTFFGDNQQLSCNDADTCKISSLSSETIMCGACPAQTNPNIQDYACDYVTSICTCAIPQLRSSSCLVNEDCMQGEQESCMLIDDNLQLSRSSILCNECQFQSMCYHTALSDNGVCACGTRQRLFQLCSQKEAERQSTLSLMLNNLCIYSQASSPFYQVEFAQTSVIACQLLDPTTAKCSYVVDSNMYVVRGYSRARRRLLSVGIDQDTGSESYTSMDPTCRDALVSENLPYTRASCQANYESSKATIAQLGLQQLLPQCSLCSFTDAIDAARRNPLAVLRIVTSPTMLLTIIQRHGPGERASLLFLTLHQGLSRSVRDIQTLEGFKDSFSLVSIQRSNGTDRTHVVHIDDKILPPALARTLELFIHQILSNEGVSNEGVSNEGVSNEGEQKSQELEEGTSTLKTEDISTNTTVSRQLLFFQELVLAVEKRVRSGWNEADRLHEAFADSVTQILTYKNVPEQRSAAEQEWGASSNEKENCDELRDLLLLLIRTTNGIHLGWRTITHERDTLQAKPFDSLQQAWPKFINVDARDSLNDYSYVQTQDMLVNAASEIVNNTFTVLDIKPSIFYNFLFSVVSAANISFAPCSYESVQTCSEWRVRLWHGILICFFYFSISALILNTFGFSFLSGLLVPFFSIVLLQLCYGYTFRCLPLIPICAFQDFTESINMLLPLSLELPDDLKSTDAKCLVPCTSDNNMQNNIQNNCLARYPSVKCTKSCKDPPFAYTSALSVMTWAFVEIGSPVSTYVLKNSHNVPFLQHESFNKELLWHETTLKRGSTDLIRAHRICFALNSYMLVPYLIIVGIALVLVFTMFTILLAQLFPILILFFSLFSAASVSSDYTIYEDAEAELEEELEEEQEEVETKREEVSEAAQDLNLQANEHYIVQMP